MCLELGGRDGNGELGDEDEDEVVGNAQPWSAWEPCQAFSAFFFFTSDFLDPVRSFKIREWHDQIYFYAPILSIVWRVDISRARVVLGEQIGGSFISPRER